MSIQCLAHEFEWMRLFWSIFYVITHQSCKDFASKGLQSLVITAQEPRCRDQCLASLDQGRGLMPRPEPDPDRIQHYNCQPEPALASLAQSADIDPLHANKTLFRSLISRIVVSKYQVFPLNPSPGTRTWVFNNQLSCPRVYWFHIAMFHWYLTEESIIFENHNKSWLSLNIIVCPEPSCILC